MSKDTGLFAEFGEALPIMGAFSGPVTPRKKNTSILWRITTLQHKNIIEYAEATQIVQID